MDDGSYPYKTLKQIKDDFKYLHFGDSKVDGKFLKELIKEYEKLKEENTKLQDELNHCSHAYQDLGAISFKEGKDLERLKGKIKEITSMVNSPADHILEALDEALKAVEGSK